MAELNYFTCTLGQAARLHQDKSYTNIPEFIDQQAQKDPELPAVGFYEVGKESTDPLKAHVHDFKTIQQGVRNAAKTLKEIGNLQERQTVALICPSSASFLYTWLGLIYLGHSVLLIAPQCTPSAVFHLCKVSEVNVVFYDESYADLAKRTCTEADQQQQRLKACHLPFRSDSEVFSMVQVADKSPVPASHTAESDVAYLHHTSGDLDRPAQTDTPDSSWSSGGTADP